MIATNFREYQLVAASTALYPKEQGREYCAEGLVGELGEIFNKLKKVRRGDYSFQELTPTLKDELGDCWWYFAMMGIEWDFTHYPLDGDSKHQKANEQLFRVAIYSAMRNAVEMLFLKSKTYETLMRIANALYIATQALPCTVTEVWDINARKLADRQDHNTIQGSGDDR